MKDKVKKINELLKAKEPENISYDSYTKYTGYKPQYIIDALNTVLGFGNWGFDCLENKVHTKTVDDKEQSIAIAQVSVWIRIEKKKPSVMAYGQSRVTRGDFGDAKKGAQTDAIKKALSYFSVGRRAYLGLLKKPTKSC